MNQKDLYFVAVKVFLEKDEKLLILKDNFGDWDLPGGRIKIDEFDTPLEEIIKRKMLQELGDKVEYRIGKPLLTMRHQRVEAMDGNPVVRIFATGYQAVLLGGSINLSSRHTEMVWVDIKTFKPEQYFSGGWLKGVIEYLNIKRNEKILWFRAKRYGWGWRPVTWQGWLSTAVYVLLLVSIFPSVDSTSHSNSDTLIRFSIPFILITTLFIILCYKKGDKPMWRWGK